MSHKDMWIDRVLKATWIQKFCPNSSREEVGELYDNIQAFLAQSNISLHYLNLVAERAEPPVIGIPPMKVLDFQAILRDQERNVRGLFGMPPELLMGEQQPSAVAARVQWDTYRRKVTG